MIENEFLGRPREQEGFEAIENEFFDALNNRSHSFVTIFCLLFLILLGLLCFGHVGCT